MKTQILEGSAQEIAAKVAQIREHIVKAVLYVDDLNGTSALSVKCASSKRLTRRPVCTAHGRSPSRYRRGRPSR